MKWEHVSVGLIVIVFIHIISNKESSIAYIVEMIVYVGNNTRGLVSCRISLLDRKHSVVVLDESRELPFCCKNIRNVCLSFYFLRVQLL